METTMIKIQIKSIWGSILFEHEKENNTIKETLQEADLQEADLRGADLWGADLRGANLQEADLRGANLRGANLQEANLRGANLREADLQGANLQEANLDYSCLHFSCKSRMPKTDERQRIQLTHHLLSWIHYSDNATDFEKSLFEFAKEYANKFHRTDVEKFK
jgi:uncharacterized protein YjbI with pentapeptide repeats